MSPLLSTFSAGSVRGYRLNRSAASGQQAYTTPGTYTFTVPAGVTSISVLCVGAGGGAGDAGGNGGSLSYVNNISVTPGTNYSIAVGTGGTGGTAFNSPQPGGSSVFGTTICRAKGGNSGDSNIGTAFDGGASEFTGGGGAGGYSGAGGKGGPSTDGAGNTGFAGTGGAGGGGGGNFADTGGDIWLVSPGGGGGGVGILGAGSNGSAGGDGGLGGGGGSGGNNGSAANTGLGIGGAGGLYGGGGGRAEYLFDSINSVVTDSSNGGNGAGGAVRIIWGPGRSYPNNAGNV